MSSLAADALEGSPPLSTACAAQQDATGLSYHTSAGLRHAARQAPACGCNIAWQMHRVLAPEGPAAGSQSAATAVFLPYNVEHGCRSML